MTTPDAGYQAAVSEGCTLVRRTEDDQWRLAELSWQVVDGGRSRRRWAADIGVSHVHVGRLVTVWEWYGGNPVTGRPAFAEAYHHARQGRQPQTAEQASWWPGPVPVPPAAMDVVHGVLRCLQTLPERTEDIVNRQDEIPAGVPARVRERIETVAGELLVLADKLPVNS